PSASARCSAVRGLQRTPLASGASGSRRLAGSYGYQVAAFVASDVPAPQTGLLARLARLMPFAPVRAATDGRPGRCRPASLRAGQQAAAPDLPRVAAPTGWFPGRRFPLA